MAKAIIEKKMAQVEELKGKLEEAKTVVAFDYPGLTVSQFTKLRSDLRKSGVEVTVYKNNISRRAAIASGYEELANELVGAKALALSFSDVVAPAKIINDFSKEHKVVKIHGGIIEGRVASQAQILELANLPSREVLLTQLAMGLLTPIRELAVGLNMVTELENN